jgi:CheY-like chemotaxis protein
MSNAVPVLLIVEDSPEQRMLLREFIPDILPCALHEAGDTDTALLLVHRERPDLVLMDLHVPPRGGMVVLRALRENPQFTGTQVIILSGSRREDEIAAIEAMAACRFIEKPYNLDDLEAAIFECLKAHVAP